MEQFLLRYSAASERGSRPSNQDNLRLGSAHPYFQMEKSVDVSGHLTTEYPQVFCVCDGIGGGELGELASLYALAEIDRTLAVCGSLPLSELLLCAAEAAQFHVTQLYRRLRSAGGCTLTMLALYSNTYAVLNIGDSPAFVCRKQEGVMTELSFRHNLAWKKRAEGRPEQKGDSARLLRYLGKEGSTTQEMAHITEGILEAGDQFLLCTDGITDVLALQPMLWSEKNQLKAHVLASQAAQMQYSDNCTAICMAVSANTKRGKQALGK